jgi:replicative DNA helicase
VKPGLTPVIRAEQALLGAVLLDSANQGHVLDLIEAEDMFRPYHGQVLAAMQRVRERGAQPGPLAVHEEVAKDPDMPRGLAYDGVPLVELMEAAPRSDHVSTYAAMVIGGGIRRRLWLAAGRMSQAAEMDDLQSALRMTERTRRELDRCRARWEALRRSYDENCPHPPGGRPGQDQIARLAFGIRNEIRQLRLRSEPDLHLVEQRLAVIAQKVAELAAASVRYREHQAGRRPVGEGRPVGAEAEAAGTQALRDLTAAPACLMVVRGWLRPVYFATPEQGELFAVMRDLDAAGHPVDPVTVSWEAARRGIQVDAADLADGVGPFAVASAKEVHRRGLLAQIDQAGQDIQAEAGEPAASTGGFLRRTQDRLARLRPGAERQPIHQAQTPPSVPTSERGTRATSPRVAAAKEPIPEAVP